MKREIIITADGSTTIHIPEWNEQYHSKYGAIQEAYHVFIKHGLHHLWNVNELNVDLTSSRVDKSQNDLSILEIGFGTGLNALITFLESAKIKTQIDYVGVEGYPVSKDEIELLNYASELNMPQCKMVFNKIHDVSWEEKHQISQKFSLTKQHKCFDDIEDSNAFHLIYFDAFGARVQPELWTEDIFKKMFNALKDNGVLVTYSAKGSVRRAMQSVGFSVEKLPGPPGKREMLRACKGA
ncbi:tRNA (5-methylaminomethyl-2-thiouridine)(34)-methyltransferase MnmD [Seonamhaeicola aphaedonensis]|uniref:tRNA U34 5-methylaminomethyl-2-thiouridine-forming methyltransferase MnmC n=1 Tax=Seonamhaeicola aphaedonensis TaxID=1461338 RepID=A0A3D9H651_9FLAO|nr:tRNA (5-methylaminomethyl-2-thiouridine)(34)-methyltransferase MnmD [Seonamhaeicola aphaedonensis]RED44985.1 tRNA U34 5-methylaminomethyl-2-thiouridine-forming methyltransferase MnmC [Seonamhaeicola aphaedonensis]